MSTGNGKTMVVFFSVPISISVCRYRLDGRGLVLQHISGHGEFLGGSVFSFSVDDFRPPLPLSLRLASNGPDHLLGEVHLLPF